MKEKKKLLIVVGAGGSIEFGLPSVNEIDILFENWALEINQLSDYPNQSLYTWIKTQVCQMDGLNKNSIHRENNFENYLYIIQSLYSILRKIEWGDYRSSLIPFMNLKKLPNINELKNEKRADMSSLSFLHTWLVDKLLIEIRERCKTINVSKAKELNHLKEFLNHLSQKFQLGIVNLNYDNVILSAFPNLKTGFNLSNGNFERELIYSPDWDFCYHLHGSVHFDMIGDKIDMHKIYWNSDLNSTFKNNSSGRSGNMTIEGIDHLSSNIITGLDKSNQILREPFATYYSQLDRLIYESDSVLFIGYGFNDFHLNSRFPFIRNDSKKIRKVVIIDFADDNEDIIRFRSDNWHYNLHTTIPFNDYEMKGDSLPLVGLMPDFKENRCFEKSINKSFPLAIWYNGFVEACKFKGKIADELLGYK